MIGLPLPKEYGGQGEITLITPLPLKKLPRLTDLLLFPTQYRPLYGGSVKRCFRRTEKENFYHQNL